MLADNVLGGEIVLKISYLPSKLRFSAKYSFFGQSLSRGHYQPTYQPPEGVYLLSSRSFSANQKARNAIVGAENLLKCIIDCLGYFSTDHSVSRCRVGGEERRFSKLRKLCKLHTFTNFYLLLSSFVYGSF